MFRAIMDRHSAAFHVMMSNIFIKARYVDVLDEFLSLSLIKYHSASAADGDYPGVPIAELDLDTLKF